MTHQDPQGQSKEGAKPEESQQKAEELKREEPKADETPPKASPLPDPAEELKNALARAMADLQNFKRRSEEDRGRTVRFANMDLLKALLPVLNNLQRSADHLPQELKADEWAKGVMGVHSDMQKILEKLGLKKIPTIGEALNPQMHEALMSGPGKKDRIVEEFEAGYTYHGEVISPAKVKVGDGTQGNKTD